MHTTTGGRLKAASKGILGLWVNPFHMRFLKNENLLKQDSKHGGIFWLRQTNQGISH
jgi:hypothetical protein